jgi:hypothetical protein
MTVQGVAVAIIVPACTLYALWLLLGVAGRRRVVAWLASGPWPAVWRRRLAARAAAVGQSIVHVHRRPR